MLFTDYFKISEEELDKYGAFNISLVKDAPLFIDPLLIYHNENPEIKNLYTKINDYLLFLKSVSSDAPYENGLDIYFCFKEIKNNWLGMSKKGNQGNALGREFAKELYQNIFNICNNHEISNKVHIEKMYLIKDGVGKDKISDFATNIILSFLVDYTEKFATKIDDCFKKEFYIDKYGFDIETKTFYPKKAVLPFIKKDGKEEYVLLTPKSILRKDEQEINRFNFDSNFDDMVSTMPNDQLRVQINNLFDKQFEDYYVKKSKERSSISNTEINELKEKIKTDILLKYPEVYDIFIKLMEEDSDFITRCFNDVNYVEYIYAKNGMFEEDVFNYSGLKEAANSKDEAKYRIEYFKNKIEKCGLWKNLYYNNEPIADEKDIQRLFGIAWCRSKYKFSPESNNGIGPVDFEISYGSNDITNIEFKLAKNSRLDNVFSQVEKYRLANNASFTYVVVFCFDKNQIIKASRLKDDSPINVEVVIVNCDKDSKEKTSASK